MWLHWLSDVNPNTLEVAIEVYHCLYSQFEGSLSYRISREGRTVGEAEEGGKLFPVVLLLSKSSCLLSEQQQNYDPLIVPSKSRPSFSQFSITGMFYLVKKKNHPYTFPWKNYIFRGK